MKALLTLSALLFVSACVPVGEQEKSELQYRNNAVEAEKQRVQAEKDRALRFDKYASEFFPPSANSVARRDRAISILNNACFECHGDESDIGKFTIYNNQEWIESGFVEKGDPDISKLITRLKNSGDSAFNNMPPEDNPQLSDDDYRHLREWIALIEFQDPTIRFVQNTINVTEGMENSTVSLELELSYPAIETTEVQFSVLPSSTASSSDYSVQSNSVVFQRGEQRASIEIMILEDGVFETEVENVVFQLGQVTRGLLSNSAQQGLMSTVNITEGQKAPVTANFVATSSQLTEQNMGQTPVSVNIQLDEAPNLPTQFDYTISGSSDSQDHNLSSGSLTINPGETSASINFLVNGDNIHELNETVIINLAPGQDQNALVGNNSSYTLTIANDDVAPTASFSSTQSSFSEELGTVNVAVNLNRPSFQATNISYTVSGTANSSDRTLSNGTITFSPGETSQNISIPLIDDDVPEAVETVIITLANQSSHTLSIVDNESGLSASFVTASQTRDENQGQVNVQVTLSNDAFENLSFEYTVAGSANQSDHNLAQGTVSFVPGERTKTISFNIQNDTTYEAEETVILGFGAVTVGELAGFSGNINHTVTIIDDEPGPTVSFSQSSSSINENQGTQNISVSLSTPALEPITIGYTLSGTANSSDYVSPSGQLVFQTGEQTRNISLAIQDDSSYELTETIVLSLSQNAISGRLAGVGNNSSHTVSVSDNDNAPTVSLSANTTSVVESNTSAITVQALLSSTAVENVQIPFVVSGTADNNEHTLSNGSFQISAGQNSANISFNLNNDNVYELSETIIIELQSPTQGSVSGLLPQMTIVVNDDDLSNKPRPHFAVTQVTHGENQGNLLIDVVFDVPVLEQEIVTVVNDGGSISTSDYSIPSLNLTFAPGQSMQQLTVIPVNDSTFEAEEHLLLSLPGQEADKQIRIIMTSEDQLPQNLSDAERRRQTAYAIIQTRCTTCHDGFYVEPSYNMTTDAQWANSGFVVPGNVFESPLAQALKIPGNNNPERDMPEDDIPLSDAERLAIEDWIANMDLSGGGDPVPPPSSEPLQGITAKIGDKVFIKNTLQAIFGPDVNNHYLNFITMEADHFGGGCDRYQFNYRPDNNDGNLPVEKWEEYCFGTDYEAPMNPSDSVSRLAFLTRACDAVTSEDAHLEFAMGQIGVFSNGNYAAPAYPASPAQTTNVIQLYQLFYPERRPSSEVETALQGVEATQANNKDKWRLLTNSLCSSPAWQVP